MALLGLDSDLYFMSTCIHSTALVNVLNTNDKVTVNGGKFTLNLQNGMPVVYHPVSTDLEFHIEADNADKSIL